MESSSAYRAKTDVASQQKRITNYLLDQEPPKSRRKCFTNELINISISNVVEKHKSHYFSIVMTKTYRLQDYAQDNKSSLMNDEREQVVERTFNDFHKLYADLKN